MILIRWLIIGVLLELSCGIQIQKMGKILINPAPVSNSLIGSGLPPSQDKEFVPLLFSNGKLSYRDDNVVHTLFDGVDDTVSTKLDSSTGGAFLSFDFESAKAQHDVKLGLLPQYAKLLVHSRIKRWWMAPSFHDSADTVPVETQLILIELPESIPTLKTPLLQLTQLTSEFFGVKQDQISQKKYALIAPLIDFSRGFRVTLFGKEGGSPAGNGVLAARVESGDPCVQSARVDDAMYIAVGTDPYKLLRESYTVISKKMKTFRIRSEKPVPPGIDTFGFCTWDAFYSSVDSDKVMQGVQSLLDVGIPPKFVIIDDGWQSTCQTGKHRQPVLDKLDGELSGAQIDGSLAADKMAASESPIIRWVTSLVSTFYTEMVEKGEPDSWGVRLWAFLAHTVLKDKLIDFFALQTDFSRRLSSWKANSKFEDPSKGLSLKNFVRKLKGDKGVNYVFVWHALAGYWGGVSEDPTDDMTSVLTGVVEANSSASSGSSGSINSSSGVGSTVGGVIGPVGYSDASSVRGRFNISILGGVDEEEKEEEGNSATKNAAASAMAAGRASQGQNSGAAVTRAYSKPTPHLLLVEPALAWDPASLAGVGSVAIDKLEEMYQKMYTYLADAGIDGVKVDAQSGIGSFGAGYGGGSAIAQACVRAMETSVKEVFGKSFIDNLNAALSLPSEDEVGSSSAFTANANNTTAAAAATVASVSASAGQAPPHPILRRMRTRLRLFQRNSELTKQAIQEQQQKQPQPPSLATDTPSVVVTATAAAAAAAAAAAPQQKDTPITLVGCMCHSTENLLNFRETGLARASDDFYPRDMAAQTVHLVSCAYNSLMLGEIAIPDWDMFHSKHPFAELHAAARAVSGGPVYVSDSPGVHDPALLRRLVLPSGRILRARLPGRPTADCMFTDVMGDDLTALKVWNLNKVGAVVGLFNVQGSRWDKMQRRYVQHTLTPPAVVTELRPRDIGDDFVLNGNMGDEWSSAVEQQHQTSPTDQSPTIEENNSQQQLQQHRDEVHSEQPRQHDNDNGNVAPNPEDDILWDIASGPSLTFPPSPIATGIESAAASVSSFATSLVANITNAIGSPTPFSSSGLSYGEQMHAVWTANGQALTLLEKPTSGLTFTLQPREKGWDVASVFRLMGVSAAPPVTASNVFASGSGSGSGDGSNGSSEAKQRPRNRFWRIRFPFLSGHHQATVASTPAVTVVDIKSNLGDSHEATSSASSHPVDLLSQALTSSEMTHSGRQHQRLHLHERDGVKEEEKEREGFTPLYEDFFGDDRIYWAPVGLLNMLNSGGAVEYVRPSLRQEQSRTAYLGARGQGAFGVYSSIDPKEITVDGVSVPFVLAKYGGCSFGGLVSFELGGECEAAVVGGAGEVLEPAVAAAAGAMSSSHQTVDSHSRMHDDANDQMASEGVAILQSQSPHSKQPTNASHNLDEIKHIKITW